MNRTSNGASIRRWEVLRNRCAKRPAKGWRPNGHPRQHTCHLSRTFRRMRPTHKSKTNTPHTCGGTRLFIQTHETHGLTDTSQESWGVRIRKNLSPPTFLRFLRSADPLWRRALRPNNIVHSSCFILHCSIPIPIPNPIPNPYSNPIPIPIPIPIVDC